MFQLERELQAWAERFGQMDAMRCEDIKELTQHVRDSIAELTLKGLSEDEAFLIATRRVGAPSAVGQEFGKVNGGHVWGHRIFWMLAGYLLFELCDVTINAVALISLAAVASAGAGGGAMAYTSTGIKILCWLGLAICLYRWCSVRKSGDSVDHSWVQSRGRNIAAITVLVILVATLMRFGSQITVAMVTSRVELGQAAVILAWANTFLAIMIPMVFLALLLTLRRRMTAPAADQ